MTKFLTQRVKTMMGVPTPQCLEGHVRLEFLFKILELNDLAALTFRLGPLQLPTIMALQTFGQNPTTVAIQMGSLDHGMSCVRKLLSTTHKCS